MSLSSTVHAFHAVERQHGRPQHTHKRLWFTLMTFDPSHGLTLLSTLALRSSAGSSPIATVVATPTLPRKKPSSCSARLR